MFLRKPGVKSKFDDDDDPEDPLLGHGHSEGANGYANGAPNGAVGGVGAGAIRRLPQEDHLIVGAGPGQAGQVQAHIGVTSPTEQLYNKFSGPQSTNGAAPAAVAGAVYANGAGVVAADGSDAGTDGEYECEEEVCTRILVAGQSSADFEAVTKALGHIESELTLWKISDAQLMDEKSLEASLTPEMAAQLQDETHYAAAVMVFDCASLATLKGPGKAQQQEEQEPIMTTSEFGAPLLSTEQFNLGERGMPSSFGSLDGDSFSSMAGNATGNSVIGGKTRGADPGALMGDRGPMQALKHLLLNHFAVNWVILVGTGCEDAIDGMDPGKPIKVKRCARAADMRCARAADIVSTAHTLASFQVELFPPSFFSGLNEIEGSLLRPFCEVRGLHIRIASRSRHYSFPSLSGAAPSVLRVGRARQPRSEKPHHTVGRALLVQAHQRPHDVKPRARLQQ
jgi:hypothetical protein